jgi:hypothetical protein
MTKASKRENGGRYSRVMSLVVMWAAQVRTVANCRRSPAGRAVAAIGRGTARTPNRCAPKVSESMSYMCATAAAIPSGSRANRKLAAFSGSVPTNALLFHDQIR